ncbi:ribose 5-phosphate isomerase B [Bosea sp. OK403]|nr:ribose 5-phosphate isomerase B [Bosea sp. OK403]
MSAQGHPGRSVVGASIAANKRKGIRADVMCICAQIIGPWLASDLITAFLAAEFSTDEDFRRRVEKLHAMDAEG